MIALLKEWIMETIASCTLSQHAKIRSKQRGISKSSINKILAYGKEYFDMHGAHIHVLRKKEIKTLHGECVFYGDKISVDRLRNTYVVTAENTIITVGHRYRPLNNLTGV